MNFNSFVFYPVWWKDFQVDLVYVPQLIYLSRYPWLCFPVDGEASWPNAFLSRRRDRLLSVPLPSHSAHLAGWGLFSGCFQVPHASHRHVWFLHLQAYCFSLLGSPVAAEARDSLALCDTRDVLPRGCGRRDGEDHWLTLIMDSAWGLWLVPWTLPSWVPEIWPRRWLLKGLGGKPRSTGDTMSHRTTFTKERREQA